MSKSGERFMRMLIFFDLPVKEVEERKIANSFRRFLLNEGYFMLQLSVYSRVCKGMAEVDVHSKRLNANLPPAGSIRMMVITEKQYSDMEILVGKKKKIENTVCQQLLLL